MSGTKTFSQMTDAEKGALLLAEHKGKKIQRLCTLSMAWRDMEEKSTWNPYSCYREKPEPVIEVIKGCYDREHDLFHRYHEVGLINFALTLTNGVITSVGRWNDDKI